MYVFSFILITLHALTSLIGLGGYDCETLDYALRCIIRHLSAAEPSADLREALLNTCYITVLIKLETFAVSDLLPDFFFFLKDSVSRHCFYSISLTPIHCLQKFTDTVELYLHHRNIYDRIMRKRIADFPLDFGSMVGLVLVAGFLPNFGRFNFNKSFTDHFPAVKGGLGHIFKTLYFQPMDYQPSSHCVKLLTEFLTDPGRAGEHALDGRKYALVAGFLLDCFIPPCSERSFSR